MSSSRPSWPTQQYLVTSQFKFPMAFRWQLLKCTNHPSLIGHNKTGGGSGLATPVLLRFLTYHCPLRTPQNHGFPFPIILITISSLFIRANAAQWHHDKQKDKAARRQQASSIPDTRTRKGVCLTDNSGQCWHESGEGEGWSTPKVGCVLSVTTAIHRHT